MQNSYFTDLRAPECVFARQKHRTVSSSRFVPGPTGRGGAYDAALDHIMR